MGLGLDSGKQFRFCDRVVGGIGAAARPSDGRGLVNLRACTCFNSHSAIGWSNDRFQAGLNPVLFYLPEQQPFHPSLSLSAHSPSLPMEPARRSRPRRACRLGGPCVLFRE
eukprot:940792-Pyramimonas_sp.AAC.1